MSQARVESIRSEVQRLMREVPFRPFVLNLENGDRITMGHSENIAFEPAENGSAGSADFYVLSRGIRLYSAFDTVSSVAQLDVPRI